MNTKDEFAARLPKWVQDHRLAKLGKAADDPEYDAEPELVNHVEDADVITSWTGQTEEPKVPAGPNDWSALAHQPETFHRPILDLDMDAHLVPSSSAAHHHLYLDKVLKWSDYVKLLDVLAELGIIEPGYRDASIAREFTAVRLPWVAKALPADAKAEEIHQRQREDFGL
jgi:hypothetical protein